MGGTTAGQPAGAQAFAVAGAAYDGFMGRYSVPLAPQFATFAGAAAGGSALDVGCGPGALTGELVRRLGAASVAACDPSESFVTACAERNPGVDVRRGSAESLPFDDGGFDLVTLQLVLHFVPDPAAAGAELARVLRPGGTVAACVWDFGEGMQLLRAFWDAAVSVDPAAPDELRVLRFGRPGELVAWLTASGFEGASESTLKVTAAYADFDELWSGFLAGVGPAGSYCVGQPPRRQAALRGALFERLGSPGGPFALEAVARAGRATRGG